MGLPAQLAPIDLPATAAEAASRGGRALVVGASGYVVADLVPLEHDDRFASYELRVENAMAQSLTAYVRAILEDGSTAVEIVEAIGAHAVLRRPFRVPLGPTFRYERASLEIHGEDVSLSVDALPPLAPPVPVGPLRRSQPALPGGLREVQFASMAFAIALLAAGSIAFGVHARDSDLALTRALAAAAVRHAPVAAPTPRVVLVAPLPQPRVRALRVMADRTAGAVRITYGTTGGRSRLLVRDARGATTLALDVAPGNGQIVIPPAALPPAGPIAIVAEACAGATLATSEVVLSDRGVMAPAPAASIAGALPAEPTPDRPVVFAPAPPVANAAFTIARLDVAAASAVTIQTIDGTTVGSARFAPGARTIGMTAPAAGAYTVDVTTQAGSSTDTVVAALNVTAPPAK